MPKVAVAALVCVLILLTDLPSDRLLLVRSLALLPDRQHGGVHTIIRRADSPHLQLIGMLGCATLVTDVALERCARWNLVFRDGIVYRAFRVRLRPHDQS